MENLLTRVAIQGEQGSFSHQTALQLIPALTDLQSCAYSAEVFERVTAGQADAAVIPIENSLAGSVLEHYDLLLAHPVEIIRELLVPIRHHLVAASGVPLSAVREVYSHPVALAQCRKFFAAHPHLEALPFYDTAGAAAHAVQRGSPVAAIAGREAARQYGGEILLSGIEDHAENYTRFLLIRPASNSFGECFGELEGPANKVSLAFAVPNTPGALVSALEIFARHRLNLTRLESRPVPGSPWQYVFYSDYQLDRAEAAELALAELAARCLFLKQLGRYRAALPPST